MYVHTVKAPTAQAVVTNSASNTAGRRATSIRSRRVATGMRSPTPRCRPKISPVVAIAARTPTPRKKEQLAPVEVARERRQHGRTQRKSQREGGDKLPRLRHRDRKIRRYFRQ